MSAKRRSTQRPPAKLRASQEPPTEPERPRYVPALIVAGLVAVSFADILVGMGGLWASDLAAYHHPLKQIFANVVGAGGFPSWNPYLSGGQPLAANPAFQTFYPPNWLVLLPPFAYWFQFHIVFHVAIAGWGMLVFTRRLGLSRAVRLMGAVSFALGAPCLSLLVRLPFLFSLAWLPWLLAAVDRLIAKPGARSFGIAAAIVGLQGLLGEPTVFAQSVVLALILVIWRSEQGSLRRNLLAFGGSIGAGVLIAAVQLLPAIDHARDSVRGDGFTWQISSNWSMPPSRLLELFYPAVFRLFPGEAGQQALSGMYPFRIDAYISEIYIGILPAVVLLAGLLTWHRAARWAMGISVPFILLAFGSHLPIWRLLYDTGLARSIRYPEKFILGALFVVLIGALFVLQQILNGDKALRRTAIAVTMAWLVVGTILAFGNNGADPDVPTEVRRLDGVMYGVWVLIRGVAAAGLLMTARHHATRSWIAAALLFITLDASFVHTRTASRMPASFFEPPAIASELAPQRDTYRLFHQAYWEDWLGDPSAEPHFAPGDNAWLLRNGMFGYRSASWGFQSVFDDDIDQTGLKNSEELRAAVVEARQKAGFWSAPVLETADVRYTFEFRPEASRGGAPDSWLPVLPVDLGTRERYFFAKELRNPLEGPVLVNAMVRGEVGAWTAYTDADLASPGSGTVAIVSEDPNRVELDVAADGTGFLVASITGHKYWRASVDGTSATLHRTNTAFQGLIVPDGRHRVVLEYRNPLVLVGSVISLTTLIALLAGVALEWRRPVRREA